MKVILYAIINNSIIIYLNLNKNNNINAKNIMQQDLP